MEVTKEQLKLIIQISHATGWNHGRGDNITFSDTSLSILFDKLKELNLHPIQLDKPCQSPTEK